MVRACFSQRSAVLVVKGERSCCVGNERSGCVGSQG